MTVCEHVRNRIVREKTCVHTLSREIESLVELVRFMEPWMRNHPDPKARAWAEQIPSAIAPFCGKEPTG